MLKYTTRNYFFNFLIAFPLKEQKSAKLHKAPFPRANFFLLMLFILTWNLNYAV